MTNRSREHALLAQTVRLILRGGGLTLGLLPVVQAQTAAVNGAQPAAASGSDLEEVIVTAQRREQNILDVPYNINSVSGADIDANHVLDTAELMRTIPGVSVVDRGDRN